MAPEIILTEISYDKSVDYWSFGSMKNNFFNIHIHYII